MKEVELTVKEGSSHITLVTEDLFIYGTKDKRFVPNEEAVLKLVKTVAAFPGVKSLQPSHVSLAPIVCAPDMIKELAQILIEHPWYHHGEKPIVTAETGIETGSVKLMRKYMAGKMLPFKPEEWPHIVSEAFGILNDNDWYPLATLIIGLPEEQEEDVIQTLELMDDLKDYKAFYVPLFFVPLENCLLMNKRGAELDSLSRARWEFLARCWEYNSRIWMNSFLEHRIRNPLLFKVIRQAVLPVAAKIAETYYGAKHGEEIKTVISKMVNS